MSGVVVIHRLTVNTKGDDGRQLSFHCDGAPDSDCHVYPDCGCESWVRGEHEHPFVSHDLCWMADWFSAGAAVYQGPDADHMEEGCIPASWVSRRGQIILTFEDDYLGWEWDHSQLVRTENLAALLTQYACSCGETMGWVTDEALVVMTPIERMAAMLRIRAAHLNHQAQQGGGPVSREWVCETDGCCGEGICETCTCCNRGHCSYEVIVG